MPVPRSRRWMLPRPLHRSRPAFTLVEALIATAIAAMAGTALLLGIATALESTDDAYERTVALGVAQQLLDEIATMRYMELGADPRSSALGPGNDERAAVGRSQYDDMDDYHGLSELPPRDRWNLPLGSGDGFGGARHPALVAPGGGTQRWRRQTTVQYVADSDPATALVNARSWHRRVTVVVLAEDPDGGTRELARVSRVFAYVPEP